MRFSKHLTEEWAKSFKIRGKFMEVFTNPTKREFNDARDQSGDKAVRWAADNKTKTLYVWSSDGLHQDVLNRVFGSFRYPSHILTGIAVQKGGKWVVEGDGVPMLKLYKDVETLKKTNWSWIEKWINIDEVYAELDQIV